MKKIIALLVSIIIVILGLYTVTFAKDDISVVINDEKVEFNVKPYMYNDRVFVSADMFEKLNADTYVVDTISNLLDGMILIVKNDIKIMSGAESDSINVIRCKDFNEMIKSAEMSENNGENDVFQFIYSSDVTPEIVDNRLFVPVRIFSEVLGCKVGWDDEKREVIIEYPDLKVKNEDVYFFDAFLNYIIENTYVNDGITTNDETEHKIYLKNINTSQKEHLKSVMDYRSKIYNFDCNFENTAECEMIINIGGYKGYLEENIESGVFGLPKVNFIEKNYGDEVFGNSDIESIKIEKNEALQDCFDIIITLNESGIEKNKNNSEERSIYITMDGMQICAPQMYAESKSQLRLKGAFSEKRANDIVNIISYANSERLPEMVIETLERIRVMITEELYNDEVKQLMEEKFGQNLLIDTCPAHSFKEKSLLIMAAGWKYIVVGTTDVFDDNFISKRTGMYQEVGKLTEALIYIKTL